MIHSLIQGLYPQVRRCIGVEPHIQNMYVEKKSSCHVLFVFLRTTTSQNFFRPHHQDNSEFPLLKLTKIAKYVLKWSAHWNLSHLDELERSIQDGLDAPLLVGAVVDSITLVHGPRSIYHEDHVLPHDNDLIFITVWKATINLRRTDVTQVP